MVDTSHWENCTMMFDDFDTNNNDLVGMNEVLQGLGTYNDLFQGSVQPKLKILQVNCSMCYESVDVYYQ